MQRINQELDVVRFLKQQKYYAVMLETLFNSTEIFLIKKHKRFTLNQNKINIESTSEEEFNTNSIKIRSKREKHLLENTFRQNRGKQSQTGVTFEQILEHHPMANKTKSTRKARIKSKLREGPSNIDES